jgi:hypothetical protein
MKNIIVITLIAIGVHSKINAQFYNNGAVFTVQNNATLLVEGSFINTQGSHFKNDGTVLIKGNITNDEVMTGSNTGSWKLQGTNQQTVSGVSQLWVKNLEINNLSGVLLNNITRVDGLIDFTKGVVGTSNIAFPLILSNLATVGNTTPIGDLNHVSGYMVKEGVSTFTFPVGDATKYQPVQTSLTTSSLGMIVKYLPNDAVAGTFTSLGTDPTLLTGYNNEEYWSVAPYLAGTATGQITVFWDGYKDTNPASIGNRHMAHKVGLTWQNEGNITNGSSAAGSVTSNILNTWSPFTLGFTSATPLPLNLLEFTVKSTEKGNQLNWKTSNEVNTSNFEVERSENANEFEKIGLIKANKGEIYEFIDHLSLIAYSSALIYYRLKMNDLDGKYTYSKILSIKNETKIRDEIRIFPNPASDVLFVENAKSNFVEISNVLGQTEKYNLLKNNELKSSINVTMLPEGMYFIKVDGNVKKFWKE